MATIVYQYGLLPPTRNAELVNDQMRLAHRYRNVLVEIERDRRTQVSAILSSHPDIAPLEARVAELATARDDARTAIRAARGQTRSRSESSEQRAAVKQLSQELRDRRAELREVRKTVMAQSQIKALFESTDAASKDRRIKARAACGVYWGTYLLQEKASRQANASKTPPAFIPYRGEGRVAVQIQGGIQVSEIWGDNTQIQIAPVSEEAHHHPCRGVRRRARRTTLRLRVGSDGRAPVWAEWPMILHRPLPPGAVVKEATISRRRRNSLQWDWRIDLTITVEQQDLRPVPAAGAVALNLGFCLRPQGGIRSGFLVGDDGMEQEILVTKSDALRGRAPAPDHDTWISNGLAKSSSIRSFRDKNLDAMRAEIVTWRKTLMDAHERIVKDIESTTPDSSSFARLAEYCNRQGPWCPPGFLDRIQSVHAWRSPSRFTALARYWSEHRSPHDATGFFALQAWLQRDKHLEPYESGLRRSALLDRKEAYRIIARRMADRYRILVIDDNDLSEYQRSPAPEDETVEFAAVKAQQRIAAGSVLRQALISAFGAERVYLTSSVDVTRKCFHCGTINTWDRQAAGRVHFCSACDKAWDQDANACQNLLREWSLHAAEWEAAREAKRAEPKVSMWERLRSQRRSTAA